MEKNYHQRELKFEGCVRTGVLLCTVYALCYYFFMYKIRRELQNAETIVDVKGECETDCVDHDDEIHLRKGSTMKGGINMMEKRT